MLRAPEILNPVIIRDANYAQCEDTRKSISGGINTIGGCLIGHSSTKQPIVALSTTESELISYTSGAQDARFTQMLMGELIGVEPVAIIFEDNAGSICLLRNPKTGSRTKHIETRYLFGGQLFQQRKVMPCFVRSEENVADGLTKNQPEKLFSEHEEILMNGHLPCRREDVKKALETMTSSHVDGQTCGIPVASNVNEDVTEDVTSKAGNSLRQTSRNINRNSLSTSEDKNALRTGNNITRRTCSSVVSQNAKEQDRGDKNDENEISHFDRKGMQQQQKIQQTMRNESMGAGEREPLHNRKEHKKTATKEAIVSDDWIDVRRHRSSRHRLPKHLMSVARTHQSAKGNRMAQEIGLNSTRVQQSENPATYENSEEKRI